MSCQVHPGPGCAPVVQSGRRLILPQIEALGHQALDAEGPRQGYVVKQLIPHKEATS